MKLIVLGASGLIGKQLVECLRKAGHEVVAASTRSGVNAVTGEGLDGALAGAEVLVDVMNSPSFEDAAVLDFFQSTSRNLLSAAERAGIRHYIALSVVGTDQLQDSGYFRAKLAQERLIQASGLPYTVVRATQFFEFLPAIAAMNTQGNRVPLPAAPMQPIASAEVAEALAEVALAAARNGVVDLAGPERMGIDDAIRQYLRQTGDAREVVTDNAAGYYGLVLGSRSLAPEGEAILKRTRLIDWLNTMNEAQKP